MGYFKTVNLGVSFEEYNAERLKENRKNEKSKYLKYKHCLKRFEPKNNRCDAVQYAKFYELGEMSEPNIKIGKEYKKYLLNIRKRLDETGTKNTIKFLESECDNYSKQEGLSEYSKSIERSKRLDFWQSWRGAVWDIWGNTIWENTIGISEIEEDFLEETRLCYNNLIDTYFWNELYLKFWGNNNSVDSINQIQEEKRNQNISEFLDFHFINFNGEAKYFIKHLWDIINLQGNKPKEVVLKTVLKNWIEEKEIELNLNVKKTKKVKDISPKILKLCADFKEEMKKTNMTEKQALTNVAKKTTELNGDIKSKKDQLRKVLLNNDIIKKSVK